MLLAELRGNSFVHHVRWPVHTQQVWTGQQLGGPQVVPEEGNGGKSRSHFAQGSWKVLPGLRSARSCKMWGWVPAVKRLMWSGVLPEGLFCCAVALCACADSHWPLHPRVLHRHNLVPPTHCWSCLPWDEPAASGCQFPKGKWSKIKCVVYWSILLMRVKATKL